MVQAGGLLMHYDEFHNAHIAACSIYSWELYERLLDFATMYVAPADSAEMRQSLAELANRAAGMDDIIDRDGLLETAFKLQFGS
jgi:hypothetical protein